MLTSVLPSVTRSGLNQLTYAVMPNSSSDSCCSYTIDGCPIKSTQGDVTLFWQMPSYENPDVRIISFDNSDITISVMDPKRLGLLFKNVEKLKTFREFELGWDGDHASKFSKQYINKAITMIQMLPYQPELYPLLDGRIQMEYEGKCGEYLEIELNTDDTINVFKIDANLAESEFKDTAENLTEIVACFYER